MPGFYDARGFASAEAGPLNFCVHQYRHPENWHEEKSSFDAAASIRCLERALKP